MTPLEKASSRREPTTKSASVMGMQGSCIDMARTGDKSEHMSLHSDLMPRVMCLDRDSSEDGVDSWRIGELVCEGFDVRRMESLSGSLSCLEARFAEGIEKGMEMI